MTGDGDKTSTSQIGFTGPLASSTDSVILVFDLDGHVQTSEGYYVCLLLQGVVEVMGDDGARPKSGGYACLELTRRRILHGELTCSRRRCGGIHFRPGNSCTLLFPYGIVIFRIWDGIRA